MKMFIVIFAFCFSQTLFASISIGKINVLTEEGDSFYTFTASKIEDSNLYDGGIPYPTIVIEYPRLIIDGNKFPIGIHSDVEEFVCKNFFNKNFSKSSRGDIFIWNNFNQYIELNSKGSNLFIGKKVSDFDLMGGTYQPIIDRIFCADQEINIGE